LLPWAYDVGGGVDLLPTEAGFSTLGVQHWYQRRVVFARGEGQLCYLKRLALISAVMGIAALGGWSCRNLGQ
jgi:hypothetical protein